MRVHTRLNDDVDDDNVDGGQDKPVSVPMAERLCAVHGAVAEEEEEDDDLMGCIRPDKRLMTMMQCRSHKQDTMFAQMKRLYWRWLCACVCELT